LKVDIESIAERLDTLPPSEKREVLVLLDELADARVRTESNKDFLAFVREVWPRS